MSSSGVHSIGLNVHAHIEAPGSTVHLHPGTSLLKGQEQNEFVAAGSHALGVIVELTVPGTKIFVAPGAVVTNSGVLVELSNVELVSGSSDGLGVITGPGPAVEEELLHIGESKVCLLTIKSFFRPGVNRGREDFGKFRFATSRMAIKTSVRIRTERSA